MNRENSSLQCILPAFVGFCIMCVALGLGRFAYTPLLPEMVQKHWLTQTMASYVGSANFFGYLLGAIVAKKLTHYKPATFWIRSALILCTLSLSACIIHWNFAWLLIWRMVAGFSGAILMVLTPFIIYRSCPPQHSAVVGGIMFGGIGSGIIFGALIVPALQAFPLYITWALMSTLAALLSLFCLIFLPHQEIIVSPIKQKQEKAFWPWPIIFVFIAYLLFGFGAVPHLLYMVDYIETILKGSIYIASLGWLFYGIGNTIGSPIFGYFSKHIGIQRTLIITYCISCFSIILLFTCHQPWIGLLSFALNGIVANSIVSLTSNYLTTLAPHSFQTHYWAIFTVFIALTQASASALMGHWINSQGGYDLMFFTTSLAMLLSALVIFMITKIRFIKS
jgi:predicted MFS family arabinose efflux permease